MPIEKREIYIIGSACLIVIIAVVALIAGRPSPAGPALPVGNIPAGSGGGASIPAAPTGYVASVPIGATVSETPTEAPASPGAGEKFRSYAIAMSSDGYSPKSVTVKKGDVVQLKLTAVDGAYDFAVPYTGLYQSVKKGETRQVGFGATMEGSFEFGCRDFCPASGVLKGLIIVIP